MRRRFQASLNYAPNFFSTRRVRVNARSSNRTCEEKEEVNANKRPGGGIFSRILASGCQKICKVPVRISL